MENNEIRDIPLDKLVPFSLHSDNSAYKVKRFKPLVDSIENMGLTDPIIVRPVTDGKYEIICGHNRVTVVKELGYDVIKVNIKTNLSDDDAVKMYYDSNANPKSFSNGNYSRKFEIVKYIEKLIKENSQQERRTDLEKKKVESKQENLSDKSRQKSDYETVKKTEVDNLQNAISEENGQKLNCKTIKETEVYSTQNVTPSKSRQKLGDESNLKNTRDKMALRLDIATSTLSKYRSIIKLPDDALQSIASFLDEKKITFEVAYRISQLNDNTVKNLSENSIVNWFIECVNKFPDRKIDMGRLKKLGESIKEAEKEDLGIIIENQVERVFIKDKKVKDDSLIVPCW